MNLTTGQEYKYKKVCAYNDHGYSIKDSCEKVGICRNTYYLYKQKYETKKMLEERGIKVNKKPSFRTDTIFTQQTEPIKKIQKPPIITKDTEIEFIKVKEAEKIPKRDNNKKMSKQEEDEYVKNVFEKYKNLDLPNNSTINSKTAKMSKADKLNALQLVRQNIADADRELCKR